MALQALMVSAGPKEALKLLARVRVTPRSNMHAYVRARPEIGLVDRFSKNEERLPRTFVMPVTCDLFLLPDVVRTEAEANSLAFDHKILVAPWEVAFFCAR